MIGRIYRSTFPTGGHFDYQGNVLARSTLAPNNADNFKRAFFISNMHGYGGEKLALGQVLGGNLEAASATRVLQLSNANGTKIYRATKDNWNADVAPNLTGYAIDTSIISAYLTADWIAFVPEVGHVTVYDSLKADGFVAIAL